MAGVSDAELNEPSPAPPRRLAVTTRDYLIHLIAHFTYHLGQVDYHRRLLTGQPGQAPVIVHLAEVVGKMGDEMDEVVPRCDRESPRRVGVGLVKFGVAHTGHAAFHGDERSVDVL